MSDKRLQKLRLKLLELLMQDTVIKKRHYKVIEEEIDGEIVKTRIFAGYRPTHCKIKDWIKADTVYRGDSARERVRLLTQHLKEVANEIRKTTFEMDKEAKEAKERKK